LKEFNLYNDNDQRVTAEPGPWNSSMNDNVTCPACGQTLRIPVSLHGHDVRCPKCATIFIGEPSDEDSGKRRVASDPINRLPREEEDRPTRRSRRDEDDEDRPRRRSRYDAYDDDDDFDRPRRRSRYDDDDDYRRRLTPHRGDMILILGILSIVVAHFILGPIAWFMGRHDLREMDEGRMDPAGRSNTYAGSTIGMIMTIVSVSIFGFVILFYVFIAMLIAIGSAARVH
jgi:hypothetical protein